MHKKTLFSRAGRLAVAVSGALALAGAALPANASHAADRHDRRGYSVNPWPAGSRL